uniref:Small-subunit processome Utp12 domain-containing protein n=1 Tax=Timema tahoe TaxID=61484 RepID=A0A7R9IME8_9NEOP|nr:unnamed protein product [Timema tahoe]
MYACFLLADNYTMRKERQIEISVLSAKGEAHLISMVSRTVVHKYRFKRPVRCLKFSPDGKHFAVCKENNGPLSGEFNPFIMERVFHGASDETTCLDWSFDSRILAVGSKDMSIVLYSLEKLANFRAYSLSGHTDSIIGCFFEKGSLDLITLSRNGQLCLWECNIESEALRPWEPPVKRVREGEESDDDDEVDDSRGEGAAAAQEGRKEFLTDDDTPVSKGPDDRLYYNRLGRHYLSDLHKGQKDVHLTCAAYHKDTHLLVTGFTNGAFFLHELPDVNLVHSLRSVLLKVESVSNQHISTVALNNTGDWVALGCQGLGQLLVWEWQSETYVMKQQGHFNNMNALAYSPDGQYVVTGGEDGKVQNSPAVFSPSTSSTTVPGLWPPSSRAFPPFFSSYRRTCCYLLLRSLSLSCLLWSRSEVKIWNTSSGFCFVTFDKHTSGVSAVQFSRNGKFVVSASLDGTVRAYDMTRYRNFRTFTSLRPVQFACLALDTSGEFVAAGGQDVFEIYLWSIKIGRLVEVLSGHEGPVVSVAFNPSLTSTSLASASWDQTLRLWNAVESGGTHETLRLPADGLCVTYKPDGEEVAVATLDGQITFFNCKTSTQSGSIEGRNDLGSGRSETDLVTAKQSLQGKAFTSLCYTADGKCILAGGQSKNVCIYNVQEALLIKKFEITQNRSFDAVDDFINRRKMTEFGNLALVEERETGEGGKAVLRLPGVRRGDMAARAFKPEARLGRLYALEPGLVFDLFGRCPPFDCRVCVCSTGQAWAAATTEGLLVYALDPGLVFDPFELELGVTPTSVRTTLQAQENSKVELTVRSLPEPYVERTLKHVSVALESTRHIEFYLQWVQCLLTNHGPRLRAAKATRPGVVPVLNTLHKNLARRHDELSKICDFTKYSLKFINRLGELKLKDNGPDEKQEDDDSDVLMSDNS